MTEPGYLVKWGWSGQSQRRFATFEEALVWLAFRFGWQQGQDYLTGRKSSADYQLVCPDQVDGAEDSLAPRQVGLTEEQWERVQEVLSWGR